MTPRGKHNMNDRLRKPKRDKIAIVAEILERARGGVQKTNILYGVGLSSLVLNRYLDLLINAKLLNIVILNDRPVFKATERGAQFLHHCLEVIDVLEIDDDNGDKAYRRIQLFPSLSS
jgi:predicted transcriptional regulator